MATATIIELMDDMHLSNESLFNQYYTDSQAFNVSAIDNLLNNNPQLANQITDATNINKLISIINAQELGIKTNVDYFLDNESSIFQQNINQTKVMGTFDSTIQYQNYNLVYYQNKGYYAYKTPPLGTLPTNANYWLEYDIRGLQGYGGVNLNFRGTWQQNTQYNVYDAVTYLNKIWWANQASINVPPSFTHFPWLPCVYPLLPVKTQIHTDEPTIYIPEGNFWFKITEGNDIVQTTWAYKTSEPNSRYASAYFTIGNKIYVVGGDDNKDTKHNETQIYDTTTDTWSIGMASPISLSGAGCFSIGTNGYMVGGIDSSFSLLNTTYIYDTVNNSWTQGANHPNVGVYMNGGCSDGNLGYIFGNSYVSSLIDTVYSYNPTSNTWTQLNNMPLKAFPGNVCYNNGIVYLLDMTNSSTMPLGLNYSYNINTGTYSVLANSPLVTVYGCCFIKDSTIIKCGGVNTDYFSVSNSYDYNINTNTWKKDIPLLYAVNSMIGTYVNGHGYVIGGVNFGTDFMVRGVVQQYT